MPNTERNELTDMLVEQFGLACLAEDEAELDKLLEDSDSDSHASVSSDEDVTVIPSASDDILDIPKDLHSQRYLTPRVTINKPMSLLMVTLAAYKTSHPEIFHRYLRVWPDTFDSLVGTIQDDEVFHNHSHNNQFPVEQQLAVALYRFGHFGNAVSIQEVSLWAGWGYGTVDRSTRHVIKALCHPHFRRAAVRWPNEEEKENAKVWVEGASGPEWHDGWLMVDGTLVPLSRRPGFYGNTWYDRKSNYSMNVQVSLL